MRENSATPTENNQLSLLRQLCAEMLTAIDPLELTAAQLAQIRAALAPAYARALEREQNSLDAEQAFSEAIAGWDQKIGCELHCKRAANWRVRLHGCDTYFVCTQHYNKHFVHLAEKWLSEVGYVECGHCAQAFPTMASIFTAVRL